MKKEPIISFQGKNANIELFETEIKIGEKHIAIKDILSHKIKQPKKTCGFLHFSLAGNLPSQKWTLGDEPDENTVCFTTEEDHQKAQEIVKYITKSKR
ncbi:MAG: hypothetical protein NTZ13_05190 [Candidatus Parcubacteria bacterium]|nr:hypothetical protein [Candidatus Parcubacteria bacterium]